MTRRPADAIVPAALFVGAACLYLATLTQVHTFDALSYVTSVERKPWQEVFHPHHLAYGPLGVLAQAAGRALGYTGGAALPMQIVNALAGALGVALLYRVVRDITQRSDAALAAALLLGTSYAYWYYAVEIEVYTVAALLLIVCLGVMARIAAEGPHGPSARRRAWLGLAQAGAVLFHQTNVFLCVPILVLAISDLRAARGGPALRAWGLYALTLGAGVALPYLWVGFGVSHFATLGAFQDWLTEYARTGWWGGPLSASRLGMLATGLAQTLTPEGGGWAWLALALIGCGALLRGSRDAQAAHPEGATPGRPDRAALALSLAVWLAVYGSFFFWWEPDNIEFWIASLPAALTLLALALRRARPWRAALLAITVAAGLGWANYGAIERRGDAATDLQRVVARALAERSSKADLLVIPDGLQELYLPYYEQRENFISINQALFDAGDSWPEACGTIRRRIETALYAGATAIVAEEAMHPPALLLERHRITQAQVDMCFAPYRADLRPLALPKQAPGYLRLATAQERAEGAGWKFEAAPQGWLAANVAGERFEQGWTFVPGVDASLTSPLMRLDTSHYAAIEIRLASGTAGRDAQLFFLGEDGRADEARSLHWELGSGDDAQTYRLDLRDAPGWQGIVTRLRIDPVGVGDGGQVRVEWVRMVK
jgi:hypothetical protein